MYIICTLGMLIVLIYAADNDAAMIHQKPKAKIKFSFLKFFHISIFYCNPLDSLPYQIDADLIQEFQVVWNSGGILPSNNRGHHVYLEKMAQRLTDHLLKTLTLGPRDTDTNANPEKKALYEEVSHHIRFCHQRYRTLALHAVCTRTTRKMWAWLFL